MPWSFVSGAPTHMAILGTTLYTLSSGIIITTDLTTGQLINAEWCTGFGGTPFSSTAHIVADPNTNIIYVSDDATNSVYSINSDLEVSWWFNRNDLTAPSALCIHNGYMYLAHPNGGNAAAICKINLSNPAQYTLRWALNSNLGGTVGMCMNDGTMYVACNDSPAYFSTADETRNALISVNMSTGVVTPVAPLFNANSSPTDIATDNTILYISRGNIIQRVSLTGTILTANWKTVPYCGGLVIYGTDIYATVSDGGDIYKFTLIILPCFKEGTKILTDKGYVPVEQLRKGHLVKTLLNEYVAIYMIGTKEISHPASADRISNQLYVANWKEVPELVEDLVITGSHCTLVDEFKEGEKEKTIEINGKVYITDNKYRVPACADTRFSVYEPAGSYTIYHFALENDNYLMNYGIYANGLLVETCSKRCIQEYSKLKIIE